MKLKTKFVKAFIDDGDVKTLASYLDGVDEFIEKVRKSLQIESDDKIVLNVFATRQSFAKAIKRDEKVMPKWVVGMCDDDNFELSVLKHNGEERTESYIKTIVLHEIVHAIFGIAKLKADDWVNEGLALYFAEQTNRKVNEKNYPTIEKLKENFSGNGGYTYAGIYVGYLLKLDKAKFLDILKNGKDLIIKDGFEKEAIEDYLLNGEKYETRNKI